MKIEYIKISNVLSFKYHTDINDAPSISFDEGLNILIGQNGSGKSTALEVINLIFKKVIFVPYNIDQAIFERRDEIKHEKKKNILSRINTGNNYSGFRLEPNWDSEDKEQQIQFKVCLDDIDKRNLDILEKNKNSLEKIAGIYSRITNIDFSCPHESFIIDIKFEGNTNKFTYNVDNNDGGFKYLSEYNYYKSLIEIFNSEMDTKIEPLHESFALIGGYRNYNAFSQSVSLSTRAPIQIQELKNNELKKSAHSADQAEPPVFGLVRLRIANIHMDNIFTDMDDEQATLKANEEPFLKSINKILKLVNLKVIIKLKDRNTWAYEFKFLNLKTNKVLSDINSLSAGEKSIVHLIFESYGRGDLKGGLIIIDEPEIHLHYQFQYEYLRIIEQLNSDQNCQYILVTHSEALISSETISKVKRFALDDGRNTIIKSPDITPNKKDLIKILDNTRSTYAFFAKKVILVEGDTDRYFFKAVFRELKPELDQEIAILDIGGKGNFEKWRAFFTDFGLDVYYIGDFDNVFTLEHSGAIIIPMADKVAAEDYIKQDKLNNLTDAQKTTLSTHHQNLTADTNFLQTPQATPWKLLIDFIRNLMKFPYKDVVLRICSSHNDIEDKIEALYEDNIFILKKGTLEDYTQTPNKKLETVVLFCQNIKAWLNTSTPLTEEIKGIVTKISA